MEDIHEAKYREMQKYVPFIQRVIEKLKVNNDEQSDNPRKAQLQKMEMLHDLLTNKHKKVKIETLTKCEGVLIKLQAKIEKQTPILQNEDSILNDVKLKQQTSCMLSASTSKNTNAIETIDISGPASPPPEVITVDDIDQPVVIPTERRCSPILEKDTIKSSADKSLQQNRDSSDQSRLQDSQHSAIKDIHSLRKQFFNLDSKDSLKFDTGKHDPTKEKKVLLEQKHYYDYRTSNTQEKNRGKELEHSKHSSGHLEKEKKIEANKRLPGPAQKLQTVKVVITEPLPDHFKQQHFPPSSKYLPRSSVCYNNLRTLPQASEIKVDNNEVYSPKELWEQYNEKPNKQTSVKTPSTAPVFSRLGDKVAENSSSSPSTSKTSGRYTPIPDVLKSPPLSVTDINNLLLESGSDKILNDISEIGTRRPMKNESKQKGSPNNSFEFVRKKLAQTAKMNSPSFETLKLKTEKDDPSISSMQQERIALKYNPHPRQERLQSVSSTDDSECSIQSKINDPRIKIKLQTGSLLHSPSQVAAANVNVLPSINLSDPRLKKQNTLPMPPERKYLLSTPPSFTSNTNLGFLNQTPISYGSRNDPRISRLPNNTIPSIQATPKRRSSISQPQYSSEENWDSDEEDEKRPPVKTADAELAKKDQYKAESRYERISETREGPSFERNHYNSKNMTANGRDILYQSRSQLDLTAVKVPLISSEKATPIDKSCSPNNTNTKLVQHAVQNITKHDIQNDTTNTKNKLIPCTKFVVPNPPKPESEEDWDSEPEITNIKQKPQIQIKIAEVPQLQQLPTNISPVVSMQISPKAFVNPKHISTAPVPPIHITQIPHTQSQYSIVGSNIHHTYGMQNSLANSRFNSILNDKSERIKYFEAKKQKANEPRTYKEFREAKERAQAQEAAIKRAADEAEAKKRAEEFKEAYKNKESRENTKVKKENQVLDTFKKIGADKMEKKSHHKDNKKPSAVESTLDKMYRTQNFSSSFPKANTTFKIPKKKTEEKTKEEATKRNETPTEQTRIASNDKLEDKIKPNQAEIPTDKIKSGNLELNDKGNNNNKYITNDIKIKHTESITLKQFETNVYDISDGKEALAQSSKNRPTKQTPVNDKTKEKENNEELKETNEKSQEHLFENNLSKSANEDNKIYVRDPRCRPKSTLVKLEDVKEKETDEKDSGPKSTLVTTENVEEIDKNKSKMVGDIVITSCENQVVLTPQENLDKFNKLTQELSSKPQRILRRRNTMVVFDSAPLVDKDKLKKANALLFEDVQEEEKRKRKQAEEDRLNARRNRHLEEMFKRTDDNCTVSTQNIIMGKRRTRATINFNETVNAINIFKHKTVKDSTSGNLTTTPPVTQTVRPTRSNFRIKIKNLGFPDTNNNSDESDDDETLETIAKREAEIKEAQKVNNKEVKTKTSKDPKIKNENKTEECESETQTQTNIKLEKKRAPTNRRSSSNTASKDAQFATFIYNDEHQNSAVSSTSTDNCTVEEARNSSTNRSFKKETNDNEPTSTASKSNNPTTTAEPYEPVLHEIVDQILTPNANRVHILGVLSQILSEEKLELIKSLIESSNTQNEDQQLIKEDRDKQNTTEENSEGTNVAKMKTVSKNRRDSNIKEDENEEDKQEDRKPIKTNKAAGGKKITMPKKKRSELDRLNEDIRDMFICNGVITATGRRMCTIMGKSTKDATPGPTIEQESTHKRKEELLKPPIGTRNLRRSVRSCKTTDDNDDNDSSYSRTTEESIDDFNNITTDTTATDIVPLRKMPVLKPHTPIKISEEEVLSNKPASTKEAPAIKRKSDNKCGFKAKKSKVNKDDSREDSESDEKESETDADADADAVEEKEAEEENGGKKIVIKNTNLHWHNQSKYTTWCMICEKKILAISSSLHYKTYHRENYISRMAPVLLQQFKQRKLNKPLFGVKRTQKQPSWFYRCPFCLKYFNAPMGLWLEHFQNHTVEYRYECSKCHRSSNRKMTISRHIKNCEEATIITSPVKLNVPTLINAHVCHLCNFIQLKRENLERHYIEQHHSEQKTVDLLGYTLTLFDVQNVECVNEKNAIEREKEAWKCIEQDEKVIDIDDDETPETISNNDSSLAKDENKSIKEKGGKDISNINIEQTKKTADKKNESEIKIKTNPRQAKEFTDASNLADRLRQDEKRQKETIANTATAEKCKIKSITVIQQAAREDQVEQKTKLSVDREYPKEKLKKDTFEHEKSVVKENVAKEMKHRKNKTIAKSNLNKSQSNDFEVIDEDLTVQNIQDELLVLAAKAAEKEEENQKIVKNNNNNGQQISLPNDRNSRNEIPKEVNLLNYETPKAITNNYPASSTKTTMSDIISSSIDMIYNHGSGSTAIGAKLSIEDKITPPTASNIFMPTRDESNYSPTIQILAQSIVNIGEQENEYVKEKPITMAERLSQRFKHLQSDSTIPEKSNFINSSTSCANKSSNGNTFEKLINDTLLELTKEKDNATNKPTNQTPVTEVRKENVFEKLFSDTVLELEKDNENENVSKIIQQKQQLTPTGSITVISDDEDWEDIEITETAPTASATGSGNMQKSKNKGLFQKFGIFKGSSSKSKKHLTPMAFLPKKKPKEKPPQITTLSHSPTTIIPAADISKTNETTTNSLSSSNAHLGFKPVVANIMDGLFPDSPCNDPIDLVPELAPLEPLQDLNDISSILDSNLSAVNINAADNHTSIEDALDFISEQQANEHEKSKSLAFSIMPTQAKIVINNISHVGFSVQSGEENAFKFYCLLENCSFLYSSDAVGVETHFMCEHSQIKWNGYCLMCESQCFPNNEDASEEHSISKEIHHMMEKHANKLALDINTDSTEHSTTSSHDNEERPKIKLRRLTGDCLSRATPENVPTGNDVVESINTTTTNKSAPLSMLGALLVAEPKPPTKEMPPQPQMPLTEPLLLDNNTDKSSRLPFRNVNSDFVITSVTSAGPKPSQTPLQISNVISLNSKAIIPPPSAAEPEQMQIPKISSVRTLAPKADNLLTQQIEKERLELAEAAEESLEVSCILKNAERPSTNREVSKSGNDSPVLVAETVPLAQSKTGDFVVTQTVSAQYDEFSSTAVGFNISIAASTLTGDKTNPDPIPPNSASIASRKYKCMGTGCKFVSRVPVAMSDHLRFHERRNFSNKQDYLVCGFCFYCASDVEDYMKHANQFHIVHKGNPVPYATTPNESDTATSLTKKIHNILKNSIGSSGQSRYTPQNQTTQVQDTQEAYLKKLRETIDEIVGPTGLADDKLYRCVIKNCHTQLTESTFQSHIMFHITTSGSNPNNYIYKCPHCSAQYHRAAGIKAHIKNHARNRYFCYLCDETSTNPGQILKHFSEKHWHTLNMYTKELLPAKLSTDGSDSILDSSYYVAYTQEMSIEEVRKFGEKLILEWQRKKSGSKTHFKSSEIDLLPLSAIFQRQVNCGECEYKTKVRTNMFRHLLMHKQNPASANKSGVSNVCSVDPVNPVPCLNSSERFFDKMTNLASSSVTPLSSGSATTNSFKLPQAFVEESKRYTCGCQGCSYHAISDDLFRTHLSTVHSTAMSFCCTFCKEEICKRGLTIDRIINHMRFHGATIYRCEECNYVHHMRYVVERHINEKHSRMKVNVVTHNRSSEDTVEGTTTKMSFTGKKYKDTVETAQTSNTSTRSTTHPESSGQNPIATHVNSASKAKWLCDVCGHRTSTVGLMQTHCLQQHAVKSQYKCAHCNFGSQQLSQILHHIDEKHSGKTREARYMYHKTVNNADEAADTRPLWQRNDPKRVRHIRGILMEDEEESEEYRKRLSLTEDVDDDSNEDQHIDVEENDENLNDRSYISGYEFGCYHCSFRTQIFEDLKNKHYAETHNHQSEIAKPFWYRLHRRLCCPECRSFIGNYSELQQHLQNTHKTQFYAGDIRMAENYDTSQRILCGYCSFHCANAHHLYRHHVRVNHLPQDLRIDNNEQIMRILALGKAEVSYQCTLCADIFSNRVAIVQHACNIHAGEDSFSFRELTNSLIYRCSSCCFTSTTEMELLRHEIDHYSRFKVCCFCQKPQCSFTAYMQHCYAEHRNDILKFRTIYPEKEIKKFLMQTLIIFPSGLVLNKRNLQNTKYGKTDILEEIYEDIYKISQQPPIPRISIARLVARKSIEVQQKNVDSSPNLQDDIFEEAMQQSPTSITKRRRTVAFSQEDHYQTNSNSLLKPKTNIVNGESLATIAKRRTTVDNEKQLEQQEQKHNELKVSPKYNKISNRRRTVAVDHDTLFSSNLMSFSTNSLLTELENCGRKRKSSYTPSYTPSPKHVKEVYPLNLDMEPFSFYGQTPKALDLSKIYTKVDIGGVKTPLTIDKFNQLFNINCQLKLTKCDENSKLLAYTDYKHIKTACPASQKLRHN